MASSYKEKTSLGLTIAAIVAGLCVFLRSMNVDRSKDEPAPQHNYKPTTQPARMSADVSRKMVELYKQAKILNSLAVEADNVVVIVGAAWNLMQITEQQATDLAATALEWGRTRNKCVRGVDFVDSSGKVLATYEPVGGVKFVSPATQPASAPTTRE